MNYIAHIHQAHLSSTSLLGNFLGDFVKGSHLQHLPADLVTGVLLHRKIDSFTDNHALVKELRTRFPEKLRRMSGVIIDIYFDHCLCVYWQQFNRQAITELLERFYIELAHHDVVVNGRFSSVKAGLLKHKWLINYQELNTCVQAFHSIEQRLKGKIKFAHDASEFIVENENRLNKAFLDFYPLLIEYVDQHPLLPEQK